MVGRTVAQYQFLEKLGAGGMGEIFKAQDTRLNRFVAIKVLTGSTAGDPERRRRFLQEAQAASALNHPNIITIHDIVADADAQFMVLEYVNGKTLVDLIPKGGLRVPQVLKYSVQMADALAAAHSAGIIHRDLKPGNVMVTEAGLIKVLDFGLAKLTDRGPLSTTGFNDATQTIADAPLTVEGSIIGTVSYMSPEQAQGRKVDARSDVFSMGLVMYEMATGSRAFSGDSALSTLSAILRDEARSIALIAPDVPNELEQVISRCLRKNPDDRWQTMQDIQRALAALKYESDSGVLYRSRLSGIAAPGAFPAANAAGAPGGPAPSGPPQGYPPQQGYPSQPQPSQLQPQQPQPQQLQPQQTQPAPQGYPPQGYGPPSGYGPPPGIQQAPLSQAPMQQPYLPQSQTGVPPQSQMGGQPQAKKSPAGVVLGVIAVVVLLAGGGGGYYWWTHRTPVETPAEPPQTAAIPATPAIEAPPPEPGAAANPPAPGAPASNINAANSKGNETKGVIPPAADGKQAKAIAAQKGQPPPQAPVTPVPVPVTPPATQAKVDLPPPQAKAAPALMNVTMTDGLPFTIALAEDVPATADEGLPIRFVVTQEFRSADIVAIPKGAVVTGQIVDGAKKRLIGSRQMTLKLVDAETNSGAKVKIRALPGKRPDNTYARPVDNGNIKNKPQGVAAPAGTVYIAYIDGDQTVSVHK